MAIIEVPGTDVDGAWWYDDKTMEAFMRDPRPKMMEDAWAKVATLPKDQQYAEYSKIMADPN